MLSPELARALVLSYLDRVSLSFDKWRKKIDIARGMMYKKDEPLACIQRYFESHSKTDWNPMKRFTGRLMARALESRLAIATLTNVPFQSIETVVEGIRTPPGDLETPSTTTEPSYTSLATDGELSGLDYLFPDLELESAMTMSPLPPTTSTPSYISPPSLICSRRRRLSHDSLYDDSDDDFESDDATSDFFGSFNGGNGLDHVFLSRGNHDQTFPATLKRKGNTDDEPSTQSSQKTGSTLTTLLNSRDQSPSSPSLGQAEKNSKVQQGDTALPFDKELNAQVLRDEQWYDKIHRESFDHCQEKGLLQCELHKTNAQLVKSQHLVDLSSQQVTHLREEVEKLKVQQLHHQNLLSPGDCQEDEQKSPSAEVGDKDEEEKKLDVEKTDLEEEIDLLAKENQELTTTKESLEKENSDLKVEVREQQRSIKRHIKEARDSDAENANLVAANTLLEEIFAKWELPVFKDNMALSNQNSILYDQLQASEQELSEMKEYCATEIEALTEKADKQKVELSKNYQTLDRHISEWNKSDVKVKELEKVIRDSATSPEATVDALLAQKDETIQWLEGKVECRRVVHEAVVQGYRTFARKHNNLVENANARLQIGNQLNQALATVEELLYINGVASPVEHREILTQNVQNVFYLNADGSCVQDEDGDDLRILPSALIDESPDLWMQGLVDYFRKRPKADENLEDDDVQYHAERGARLKTDLTSLHLGRFDVPDEEDSDQDIEDGQVEASFLTIQAPTGIAEEKIEKATAGDEIAEVYEESTEIGSNPTTVPTRKTFSTGTMTPTSSSPTIGGHSSSGLKTKVSLEFSNTTTPMKFSSPPPDAGDSGDDTRPLSPSPPVRLSGDIMNSKPVLEGDQEEAQVPLLDRYAATILRQGFKTADSDSKAPIAHVGEASIANTTDIALDAVALTAAQKRNAQRKRAKKIACAQQAEAKKIQETREREAAETFAAAKAREENKNTLTPHERTLKRRLARKASKQGAKGGKGSDD